ncbi:replicative helicase loader/inhibitor [Paenibacillus sp. Pae108]|uniref:replicative helicase loader/inhibitor n=1 Tax=Paenibacillus sp. Pae108 TaxID=2926019 RepID=UPI002117BBA3|nr:replicative helicase loader/inhibitor [Paenibacillus sp. Pae108]
MKKSEFLQIIAIIRNNYNNFLFDDLKEALWFDLLKDLPDGAGLANVRRHIMTSKYPPTIADIRQQAEVNHYDQLRIQTAERFAEMERWKQEAVPLPEHLIPKSLTRGDDS